LSWWFLRGFGFYAGGWFSRDYAVWLDAGSPGYSFFGHLYGGLRASLSAFWILAANSWMQTPAGIHQENNRFVVDSYIEAIFNKNMLWGVSHMWFACLATSLFVIGGLSAWYIFKGRNTDFFLKSFKLALIGAIFVVPIQLALGHGSGREVFVNQPAKGAATEAHWITNQEGTGAAWNLLAWPNKKEQKNDWVISIPNGLSFLATGVRYGQVQGLKSFPKADQPTAIALIFYSFRIMVTIGIVFFGLMLWTLVVWLKGQLSSASICNHRLLLRAWIASTPLGYVRYVGNSGV
jgi:cytochrome bd ubiquinol oxidase subunit I